MAARWIVVANAGRARIFRQEGPQQALQELEDIVNPELRLRTIDTESDQIGQLAASKSRFNVGAATPPSGYEPNQLPSEHQAELFARHLMAMLRQAQLEGQFDRLTLAASPQFLGLLRQWMAPHVGAVIDTQINKDYTALAIAELKEQLPQAAPS